MTDQDYTPVTDWTALGPQYRMLEIELPGRSEPLRLRIRELTPAEWDEVEFVNAPPLAPKRPDKETAAYLDARHDYERDLTLHQRHIWFMRYVMMLEGGGNPIPGDTVNDKAEFLAQQWSKFMEKRFQELVLKLHVDTSVKLARVEARADSFHGTAATDNGRALAHELDDAGVARDAGS